MTAVHSEQARLLATALNNIAVAYVVIGFVTPMTAASFGVPSAPALRVENAIFTLVWLGTGCALLLRCEACPPEPEAVNYDWIFVTFGIPAITLAIAYAAVRANERAAQRLDPPAGE